MSVGLLAPEYVATIAFTELRTALIVRSHMRSLGYGNWTLAQSFFAAMGGYMIQVNNVYKPISAENFIVWQRRGLIRLLSSVEATFWRTENALWRRHRYGVDAPSFSACQSQAAQSQRLSD